jgi:hypothetical protein
MNLYLRTVVHPQAHDNYRVVLKLDGDEFEIGSIGIEFGAAWAWGIDTVIPMRAYEAQGEGSDRSGCMKQFKAAWDRFAADEANLIEFLEREAQAALDSVCSISQFPTGTFIGGNAQHVPILPADQRGLPSLIARTDLRVSSTLRYGSAFRRNAGAIAGRAVEICENEGVQLVAPHF